MFLNTMELTKHLVIIGVLLLCGIALGVFPWNISATFSRSSTFQVDDALKFSPDETFSLEKKILSQFHWTYSGTDIKVQQMCFTAHHDTQVFQDGDRVFTTDQRFISGSGLNLVRNYAVLDGEKNEVYRVKVGNLGEEVIRNIRLGVSFLLYKGDEIIAYVKGSNFINDNLEILDAKTDEVILKINRNKITVSEWKWEITQVSSNTDLISKPLISVILGNYAFAENSDKTDVCNTAYLYTLIFSCICFGLIPVYIVYAVWKHCKQLTGKPNDFNVAVYKKID